MCSNANPERGEADLTRGVRVSIITLVVTLAAALWPGSATTLLLPLIVGATIAVLRYHPHAFATFTPFLVALVLVVSDVISGATLPLSMLLVIPASVPGWLWRREARRATREPLPGVPSEARATAPDTADEHADLERALGAVAHRLDARGVILWDVNGAIARPRVVSGVQPPGAIRLAGDALGWAWEQGMRLRLEPPPRWAEPGTTMVAERLRREEDAGLVVTYSYDPAAVPQDDRALDEAAVYLRGLIALHEARAGTVAGQRRTAALLAGLRRIPGELELAPLAADLCTTAMNITDATGAVIGMWEGEKGVVLATAGADGGPQPGDEFTPPTSELGLAIRADAMIVRDADAWKLGSTSVAQSREAWVNRPRALAALPLHGPAGITGVIAVWTSRDRALDSDALELLHALIPYAALHLEHARAFGRLRETAARDPLTQLRNRRAFDEIFEAEASRFERYLRPLSLMILDLDHFKSVNDRYGHEAGDEVLRNVSRTIAATIRDVDTAARLGGEEFVVLMPETTRVAAGEVAERVRSAIAAQPILWQGTPIQVRISIGVATAPDSTADPATLVSTADAALYRAKAAGRDRVVVA